MIYKRAIYVVFMTVPRQWWSIFMSKKINHCYFITPIDKERTILINQTEGGLEINSYNVNLIELSKNIMKNGAKDILRGVVTGYKLKRRKLRFFRSCVGLTKDALGIKAPFALTPMQLYKYMVRRQS